MADETKESLNAFALLMAGQAEETIRHCLRLREDCVVLAESMGLEGKALRDLEYAALLHDIGMFRVPYAVRGRQGPFTDEDWEEVRRHPDHGAEMVASITTLERAARLIRTHHERWDGAGYPRGLAGEAIPLGARILSVVDTFDAIVRRSEEGIEGAAAAAMEEIRRHAGSQFDPAVVRAMERALPRIAGQRRQRES